MLLVFETHTKHNIHFVLAVVHSVSISMALDLVFAACLCFCASCIFLAVTVRKENIIICEYSATCKNVTYLLDLEEDGHFSQYLSFLLHLAA